MRNATRTIGGIRRYRGDWHPGIRGHLVEILRVHRNGCILEREEDVGVLDPTDIVEFAPLIDDGKGFFRRSFVTSDARPEHFEAINHERRS